MKCISVWVLLLIRVTFFCNLFFIIQQHSCFCIYLNENADTLKMEMMLNLDMKCGVISHCEMLLTTWKGKYRSRDNTTIKKERVSSYKKWDLLMKGTHKHMEAMITDVFLDKKRVIAFEHTVKMAPRDRFERVPPELVQDIQLSLHPHHSSPLPVSYSLWCTLLNLSYGTIFTVCSHTFILSDRERHLWSSKRFS